jgi:hypothetical protein
MHMQSITTDKRGKQVDNKEGKPIEVEPTDEPTSPISDQPTDKTGEPANEPVGEICDKPNNQAANNFFQAIGILSGKLIFDRGFKIELDGKQYNAKFKNDNLLYFVELGKVGRFALYPKVIHFPARETAPTIYFDVVAISYSDSNNSTGLFEKLQDNEFILCGLWQFIPVCPTPVVSVLHNYNDDLLAQIAKLSTAAKCKKLKAQHLPLIWKPPIVPAFRYQKDAEVQEEKYFISVKATLDIKREVFIFERLIGMPTTEVPKGFVVGKAMKAEALQGRKERTAVKSTTSFAKKESTTSKKPKGSKASFAKKAEAPKPKPKPKPQPPKLQNPHE